MKTPLSVCLLALIPATSFAAEAHWIRMQSPHFEIYTTAGEKSGREGLRQFEQVHDFFRQLMGGDASKDTLVRLIAFNSAKEFEPYRPNEVAIAYYQPGAERDTIVLSRLGSETYRVAVHEYVHLVAKSAGLKAPPWLGEGLAELYSTLRPYGNKVVFGEIIPGRYQALLREKWVPLSTIVSAEHDSPYYNEKDKAGSLYNEGWALTHMLALSDPYRPGFPQLLEKLQAGVSSEQALTATYGKPLALIDRDLQAYLRGTTFKAATFPTKLDSEKQDLAAEDAPMFDVKLILANLGSRPGNVTETKKTLEALAAEDPKRPEVWEELGFLEFREGQTEAASKDFEKAYAMGARGSRMLWDYGRIIQFDHPKQAMEVFRALLAADPGRIDVKIELASAQLNDRDAAAAEATLGSIKGVSRENAARFFIIAGYAELNLGHRDAAAKIADRLRGLVQSEYEKGELTRLDQGLKQSLR